MDLPLVTIIVGLTGYAKSMRQNKCDAVVIDHNERRTELVLTMVKTTWSETYIYVRCYKCGHEWIE